MKKMYISKKYRLFWNIFWIGVLFLLLYGAGSIEINFWSNQKSTPSVNTFSLSGIQNITGTLAISPTNSFDIYHHHLSKPSTTIKIWTYDFTEQNIKEQLRALLDSGTKIKLIMENYKYKQYKNTRNHIQEYFSSYSGFQLHSDKGLHTQYQHAKVTLLDDFFAIHTANLTHSSFFKNREYWFRSTHPEVLASLHKIFGKDRNQQEILLEDIHPNILVCPINCRIGLETLLQSAKESIIMQEQYLADERIVELLKNKAEDPDFNIKITLARPSDNYTWTRYFWTHRVRVLKKPYLHAKMILIDKKYLILGSMNISTTSLDRNREVGIILTDTWSIHTFLKQFTSDWEQAWI